MHKDIYFFNFQDSDDEKEPRKKKQKIGPQKVGY